MTRSAPGSARGRPERRRMARRQGGTFAASGGAQSGARPSESERAGRPVGLPTRPNADPPCQAPTTHDARDWRDDANPMRYPLPKTKTSSRTRY